MTLHGLHQDTYSVSYPAHRKQESAWSAYLKIKLGSANAMKSLLWALESIL